jgi:hypothetical protein
MAHKKKHHRKTHRRPRRMGAVHPALMQSLEMIGGAAVGGIAAAFINQAVKSSFATAPMWVGGGVCVVAGAAIPMLSKPSPLLTGIAGGMAGMGTVFIMNETFLSIPGISGMPTGVPSAMPQGPGYISQKVGYRNPPPSRLGRGYGMGALQGGGAGVVGSIISN